MWNYILKNRRKLLCNKYKHIWSYFVVNKSWLKLVDQNMPNILFLHYNDLRDNTLHEISKIAIFLGYNYDDITMNKILEKCNSKYMKQNTKDWTNCLTNKDIYNYFNILPFFFTSEQIKFITS